MSFALTVAGSVLGVLIVGLAGVLVGFAIGVASYLTGRRGETLVREIERGESVRE